MKRKPKPVPQEGEPTYTPEQVADAFKNIRDWVPLTSTGNDNLDLIEVAYQEAIETEPQPPQQTFQCWDATSGGKLAGEGLPRMITPSESNWFPTSARGAPDLNWIKANTVPKFAQYDPLVIDIECWIKKENENDPAKITATETEWLRSIVEVHQQGVPGQRVCVYSLPPERYGGCSSVADGSDEQKQRWNDWTDRNAIMAPLAEQVYAITPSLYGLYSKMDQWVKFAKQNVEQCRMLAPDKPVIGYLWPEWHNNAEATGFISYDDWMIMLETCFECCDGIAIWEGSWWSHDANAPWWRATVDFMTNHSLNGR